MQFPFSLFGDLLAEFQKYLTDRISRPVYWITGLVVVVLGSIVGYLAIVGMMVLHSVDPNKIMTDADVIALPPGLDHAMVTALSISALNVPTGLAPGDLIAIYAQAQRRDRTVSFKSGLVLEVREMPGGQANEAQANLVHLTLAIAPGDVEAFLMVADKPVLHIVLLSSCRIPSPTPQTTGSLPVTQSQAAVSPLPPTDAVVDQLKILDKEYKDGKRWIECLRTDEIKVEIPSHMDALEKAFALIEHLSATVSKEQREEWLHQVNAYLSGWVNLLQEADKEIAYRIDQYKKPFLLYYPSTIERVAPTAIGNVFRAVDSYCDRLYGLDIALVLPRLQIVMEESTRDQLTKAHDQLELFEWLYLGSITVGIVGAFIAFHAQHYLLALLLWLLVLPIPRFILYPAALNAALDYAVALCLAVDRERGKIIAQAGFSLPLLTNQEQERELWQRIQQWWVYGISPGGYTLTIEGTGNDSSSKKDT